MKLHIGCFDRPSDGWVNIDITPHIWISRIPGLHVILYKVGVLSEMRYEQHKKGVFRHVRYMNVAKPWGMPTASVEAVFSCHMLEHLYYDDARECLREAHRVLRDGGVIRIGVPDLDRCIEDFAPERAHEWVSGFFESRLRRNKNAHHWMYNERTLRAELQEIGFTRIERFGYRSGECPDVDVLDDRPESLFMEAHK